MTSLSNQDLTKAERRAKHLVRKLRSTLREVDEILSGRITNTSGVERMSRSGGTRLVCQNRMADGRPGNAQNLR